MVEAEIVEAVAEGIVAEVRGGAAAAAIVVLVAVAAVEIGEPLDRGSISKQQLAFELQ
jgi:hypothetical protein